MKTFKQFSESMVGEDGDKIYHPSGGYIDIHTKPKFAPRKQSVIDFVVPERERNKGIGDSLVKQAMSKHTDLGAQVSSPESLKVFHNNGFRNPEIPDGNYDEHKTKFIEHGGSLFMAMNDKNGDRYVK